MWIKKFGDYVMRGRREAALTAIIFTLIPFFGWVGVVIMALVTLRQGIKEGALILGLIAVPSAIVAIMGHPMPFVFDFFAGSLVAFIGTVILRETRSWVYVLQGLAVLAMVVIVVIHAVVPDLHQLWFEILKKSYGAAKQDFNLKIPAAQLTQFLHIMSRHATGAIAVMLLFISLFNVLIARWWQATLYNPGGLSKELYQVRLGPVAMVIFILIIIGMIFKISFVYDFAPLAYAMFLVAGLSLIHAIAKTSKAKVFILVAYYILLILFFPYIGSLTVVFAVFDTFLNFRKKFQAVINE